MVNTSSLSKKYTSSVMHDVCHGNGESPPKVDHFHYHTSLLSDWTIPILTHLPLSETIKREHRTSELYLSRRFSERDIAAVKLTHRQRNRGVQVLTIPVPPIIETKLVSCNTEQPFASFEPMKKSHPSACNAATSTTERRHGWLSLCLVKDYFR